MHPAYSVILFTTASGAGYGLLFWLSLFQVLNVMPGGRWLSLIALVMALALITAGLLSSTLHLGHPERAIGAFSQWRSSWLSREGMAAVATYAPAALLGVVWLFDIATGLIPILALLAMIGAVVTVYCTGMIYASLRTIRQWNMTIVPLIYLALAAATGALLFGFIVAAAGHGSLWVAASALISLITAAAMKLMYWSRTDSDPGLYTAEMALGLPTPGKVRRLDPPHTMPNFVMREMGYSVARKHARKLRSGVIIGLFALPILFLLIAALAGGALFFFALAIIAAGIGVIVERWLFFAEAEHVSMLYYGLDRA